MSNAVLFIITLWLLSGFMLALHRLSRRVGFVPFMIVVGGIAGLIQVQSGVFIEPMDGLSIFLSSGILVPVVLMCALVIYIANGAVPARLTARWWSTCWCC